MTRDFLGKSLLTASPRMCKFYTIQESPILRRLHAAEQAKKSLSRQTDPPWASPYKVAVMTLVGSRRRPAVCFDRPGPVRDSATQAGRARVDLLTAFCLTDAFWTGTRSARLDRLPARCPGEAAMCGTEHLSAALALGRRYAPADLYSGSFCREKVPARHNPFS